jgi:putative peptidoglycan lipid II flippase
VLFERGAFDGYSTEMTAMALGAYAMGLPAYVLVKVLGPAYFGRLDIKTPVVVGIIAVAANLVLNLILMRIFQHVGLAMATAISAWLNVFLLAGILYRRGHFKPDKRLVERLENAGMATVIMAVCLGIADWALAETFQRGFGFQVGVLVLLIATGVAVYGLSVLAFGVVKPAELRALLGRGRDG